MASERQIAANRRNSARSTGPKTEAGKARSRSNATTHGLAARLDETDITHSPEFVERRAKWAGEPGPVGEAANWALDRAVAATFRIERCERAVEAVVTDCQVRAMHCWDEDRASEAANLASGLARNPVVVARRLRTSLAGVKLLIEAWLGLIAALGEGRDWSEGERSKALDLLGLSPDLRSGRTIVDPDDGENPIAFRLELAFEELERLEALRDESMVPLDESDRRRALKGDVALLSKPARLVLRYEREAWRNYHQAMAQVREPAQAPEPPKVVDLVPADDRPSPTAPQRAVDEAAPAACARAESGGRPAPERSQFGGGRIVAAERSQSWEAPAGRVSVELVGAPG